MDRILINGTPQNKEIDQSERFEMFIDRLRREHSNKSQVVSKILVDDSELTIDREKEISSNLVAQFKKVEIETSPVEQVTQETIELLTALASDLAQYSHALGKRGFFDASTEERMKLIDGLDTFVAGVRSVRSVYKTGADRELQLLQVDLFSIMEDVFVAIEEKQKEYLEELLTLHIPNNLAEWHSKGLVKIPQFERR